MILEMVSAAAAKRASIRLSTGGSITTNGALNDTCDLFVEDMFGRNLSMSVIQKIVRNRGRLHL